MRINHNLLPAMKQYNEAIKRYQKAEVYFAREDVTNEEKFKQVQNCHILTNHIGGLIQKIKDMDYPMSDEEILLGFRQVEFLKL